MIQHTKSKKTVCLCMMVKNESQVIARALESALPYIDYWVICDTGSTDGTPELINAQLKDIQGELHHSTWKNFGHNRAEVIGYAKEKSDYLLIMDADMILKVKAPFKDKLSHDYYELRYQGPLDYTQPMLISTRHNWQYNGVTHEYISAETAKTWAFLPEVSLIHFGDGGNRQDKFERDIQLLSDALKEEPENARYQFYLAQSYKDIGNWEQALIWYEKRIADVGWPEEHWYAMYQAAEMKNRLNYSRTEVISAYQAAFDERPIRLEPVYGIAKYYRERQQFYQGYLYSAIALQGLQYPDNDKLFIEKPVYTHLLLLEHIICALACGRLSETVDGANMISKLGGLPEEIYEHACNARKMALDLIKTPVAPINALKNKITVIVPFYNPGEYLVGCLASLEQQDYEDFRVIFIDDASTDATSDFIPPSGLDTILVRNRANMGALFNINEAINSYCGADEIVVCLDGDDRLACSDALSFINAQYQQYDCWVMYGQYLESSGAKGISAPFSSPRDLAGLRLGWRSSHLRTFRAGLFCQIAVQDPQLECFKDSRGDWFRSAADAAIMFPLIEMAGFDKVQFNDKVLYLYNLDNPESHHHGNKPEQDRNFDYLQTKRPFAKIGQYQRMELLLMEQ